MKNGGTKVGTSFFDVEAEIEDGSTSFATEAELIQTIDGNHVRVVGFVPILNHNTIVARHWP